MSDVDCVVCGLPVLFIVGDRPVHISCEDKVNK